MTPRDLIAAIHRGGIDGALIIAQQRAALQRRDGYPDRAAAIDDYAAEVALVCGVTDDDADGGMAAELRRVVA